MNLKLYVPCIMFRCVDKPTRDNTSYEWSLLSINWLYMFRTITSPSSGASYLKLYNALVYSYSLWYDAPDDGLVIVRNIYSQIMDNEDHSLEVLHLVGLSTHWEKDI